MKVAVVIPTLRRPQMLERAVRSVFAQSDKEQIQAIVVVDNDPKASAAEIASVLTAIAPFPLIYAHEPKAGIATARNTGIKMAPDTDYIAFLDDDEVASPQWLAELLKVQTHLDADVVFGPITGVAPLAKPAIRPVVEAFFSRFGSQNNGPAPHAYGCGNSLLRRETTLQDDCPFCTTADQTGGEDDILFAKLAVNGAVFGWASRALVEEHVPAERSNLSYLLRRGFARGQGPSQTASAHKQYAALTGWMTIGVAQFVNYGCAALIMGLGLTTQGARLSIRAAEGAGKLLWFKRFEPKLYGQSQL